MSIPGENGHMQTFLRSYLSQALPTRHALGYSLEEISTLLPFGLS